MNTIQAITDEVVKSLAPDQVILFGSWAWGTPTVDSDIDLCILKDSAEPLQEQRQVRLALFGKQFPAIDLLMYSPKQFKQRLQDDDVFIKKISSQGKVLYAKK